MPHRLCLVRRPMPSHLSINSLGFSELTLFLNQLPDNLPLRLKTWTSVLSLLTPTFLSSTSGSFKRLRLRYIPLSKSAFYSQPVRLFFIIRPKRTTTVATAMYPEPSILHTLLIRCTSIPCLTSVAFYRVLVRPGVFFV